MIEEYDCDIRIFDKQIDIEKKMFAYHILNGMGDHMKKELETHPSKYNTFILKIKLFFYKIFNIF